MKLTEENKKILLKLGFKPEDKTEQWWRLTSGWSFRIDAIKGFKHLINRLMKTEYERGCDEAYWENKE